MSFNFSYIIFFTFYFVCTQAQAGLQCSSILKEDNTAKQISEISALINQDISLFAEELAATPEGFQSFSMKDRLYAEQGEDPFTSRTCREASKMILHYLDVKDYDVSKWVEYITVHSNEEQAILDAAVAAKTDAEYETILQTGTFGKHMGAVDHSVVFNVETGILIDLTYRQFLINKIPEADFNALPKIFIGTLTDFRNLVEPHLGRAVVDRMLTSAGVDRIGEATRNLDKPTLLQFESGEKTSADVLPSFIYDMELHDGVIVIDVSVPLVENPFEGSSSYDADGNRFMVIVEETD